MLTVKQPGQYGFKSVHDLPTPPSTSRPSPPLAYSETAQKPLPGIPRSFSPSHHQPMSAPHRGLPLPSAIGLPQQSPQSTGHAPPPVPGPSLGPAPHQHHAPPPPPPPPPSSQMLAPLPPPPQWQQGAEESFRAWLVAKAEEEKRRAEEERTRQEQSRLEQRRIEIDILRTSLQGGIPPPMVPVVFAGMGGGSLPQTAMDWAQQYMYSQTQSHQPQLLPVGAPHSPTHRRDSQTAAYGTHPTSGGVPSTPGSAQGPQSGFIGQYPPSPTRARGYSVPGSTSRPFASGSNLPTLNTNIPQSAGAAGAPAHPGVAAAQQQEQPQASPSIYFHHWQPPSNQASGGSSGNQPGTPAGSSKNKSRS